MTRPSADVGGRRARLWLAAVIGLMSVVYALAMFRGVECHSGYQGSIYQVLHPGSFPNDPFMALTRPTLLSLYYLVVRGIGPLWLDDRFTILVYAGIVTITLIGVDKTVRLLGGHRLSERVAILSMMLLGHVILENHAFIVDNNDFNPTALAGPFIIWLLYHSLAGSRPRILLPLTAISVLLSIKSAWLPSLIALVVLWREHLGRRGKVVAGLALLAILLAALGGYYAFLRPSDGTHEALFDYLHRVVDNTEANPFMNSPIANLAFVGLCVAGWMVRGLPSAVRPRIRAAAAAGLAVWLIGGTYLSCAPDLLKIPYLVPFDPTRALWWPQYVLFMGLGVALLKGLQGASSAFGIGAAWAGLMGLYFTHNEFRVKLAVVVSALTVALWWLARRAKGGRDPSGPLPAQRAWRLTALPPERRRRIVAITMCLGTLSVYGVGTLHHRINALTFLSRHGIMGDNGGAIWVGVNEYIREHTPPSATVLALTARNALGTELGLRYDGSLRTRTGRSMPIGHPASVYFDYEKQQWLRARNEHVGALLGAWERRDASEVSRHLAACGAPDYLVVPTDKAEWLQGVSGFDYAVEAQVGDFMILRRVTHGGGVAFRVHGPFLGGIA